QLLSYVKILLFSYQRNLLNDSISTDFVFRYTIMIIASPTATSAAAKAMMKKTNTCPLGSPRYAEKAANNKLTEFNINSMDIMMMITFLRISTPVTPIANIILQKMM